jgi:hypothetical protein
MHDKANAGKQGLSTTIAHTEDKLKVVVLLVSDNDNFLHRLRARNI